jgi:hypothetical protein
MKDQPFPNIALQNGSSTGNSLLQVSSEPIAIGNFSTNQNSINTSGVDFDNQAP